MRNVINVGSALALAAAVGFSGAVQAQSPAAAEHVTHVNSARELAAVCDPTASGMLRLESIAYCQGFLTSFGQYHALAHPVGRSAQLFCVPDPGPTVADSGLNFARWLRSHPQRAAEPALEGLLRWAEATYPCPPSPAAARRTPRSTR